MPVFMIPFRTCSLVKTDVFSLQLWVLTDLSIHCISFYFQNAASNHLTTRITLTPSEVAIQVLVAVGDTVTLVLTPQAHRSSLEAPWVPGG